MFACRNVTSRWASSGSDPLKISFCVGECNTVALLRRRNLGRLGWRTARGESDLLEASGSGSGTDPLQEQTACDVKKIEGEIPCIRRI